MCEWLHVVTEAISHLGSCLLARSTAQQITTSSWCKAVWPSLADLLVEMGCDNRELLEGFKALRTQAQPWEVLSCFSTQVHMQYCLHFLGRQDLRQVDSGAPKN